MRNLKTSDITSTVAMPIKEGTLRHLQLAYKEIAAAVAMSPIKDYSSTEVYILQGLNETLAGSNVDVTEGWVYFNGEIYYVNPFSYAHVNNNGYFAGLTTTFFNVNADPTQFSDLSNKNVHEIRSFTVARPPSGGSVGKRYLEWIRVGTLANANNPRYKINNGSGGWLVGIDGFPPTLAVFFNQDYVEVHDPQDYLATLSIVYDFTGAKVGSRYKVLFGLGNGTCAITIPVVGSGSRTMTNGFSNSFSLTGSTNKDVVVIDFEYLGVDQYGVKNIRATIHKNA